MLKIYSNYFFVKDENVLEELVDEKILQSMLIKKGVGMIKMICDNFSIDEMDEDFIELFQLNLKKGSVACFKEICSNQETMDVRCLIVTKNSYKMLDFEDYILEIVQKEFDEFQYDIDMVQQKSFDVYLNSLVEELDYFEED